MGGLLSDFCIVQTGSKVSLREAYQLRPGPCRSANLNADKEELSMHS